MIRVTVRSMGRGLRESLRALNELDKLEVCVGVPQKTSSRAGSINNAELAYIHTHGSPARGFPARPIIEPALDKEKEYLASMLQKAVNKALDGSLAGAKMEYEKTGMEAASIVKDWFTNPANGWAPLHPKTIKRKGGKERPLIDEGALRDSIDYVVRRKT